MTPGPLAGSSTFTRRYRVVVVLVVSLVLSGCSGNDQGSSPVSDTLTGAGAFAPHRSAPAAPIQGAGKGGTVTVLSSGDLGRGPDWTDPTGSYWITSNSILSG